MTKKLLRRESIERRNRFLLKKTTSLRVSRHEETIESTLGRNRLSAGSGVQAAGAVQGTRSLCKARRRKAGRHYVITQAVAAVGKRVLLPAWPSLPRSPLQRPRHHCNLLLPQGSKALLPMPERTHHHCRREPKAAAAALSCRGLSRYTSCVCGYKPLYPYG